MRKLFAIRIEFRYQAVCHIDFHVLTIGTDHCNSEGLVSIPARPVKSGFEDDLLFRVALRFVKPRGRLRNTEDIADAVIANAIARTEIRMRVVVESAPAKAAGVSLIRGQLIMDPSVTHRMFRDPLDVIIPFRWIHVPDELGV